ncbi:unnamed protein product [Prorocentrum cordatum]|uniref:FLZ-type domain-containing protein n=1 Tax=Prorocentrum cordatum TaxID=2364126 RepID=A0ABN9Q923_9DINO|nr:unnamed protein product [Polarella glacialis]|mmetsp:Transcript_10685/g.28327  ORF Transcript_10685/g.28327 Transcript_10685/m.28327 type:complete len:200 (+) Transcript_10685:73-672(+)
MVVLECGTVGSQEGVGRVPDYLFRCSYCIKLIAEDCAVYMRHDQCYCSPMCRDKGMSRLYTSLKESQLSEARRMSSGSLAAHSRVKSDTSLSASLASRTDTLKTHDTEHIRGGVVRGLLSWLGQKFVDAMLQRVASRAWGTQALRTYSSGMLWGREFTKHHSSAQLLFNYLPEVDHLIKKSDSCFSERSDLSPISVEVQ